MAIYLVNDQLFSYKLSIVGLVGPTIEVYTSPIATQTRTAGKNPWQPFRSLWSPLGNKAKSKARGNTAADNLQVALER